MKIIYRLFGACLVALLAGCAAKEDILILDKRTQSLEQGLYQLKEAQEGLKASLAQRIEQGIAQAEKKAASALQPVHQHQADTASQIEALKIQIQDLQGRLESFEYNQKREQNRLMETLLKELKDYQARLQRLEHPPAPPPPPPPPPPAAEAVSKPEKVKETLPESKEEPKEAKEPAKEAGKARTGPEEIFTEAGGLLKKQAFEGAKKKFEEYLKVDPRGKHVEEARFGLAEALYGTKNFEEAILAYQKLIKAHPKSRHIPGALYKQALSFINLKDTGSARLLLEKIIKSYPKSDQAKLAKKKLKAL